MGFLQQVQGTPNGNHGDLSSEVFTQQIGVVARKLLSTLGLTMFA